MENTQDKTNDPISQKFLEGEQKNSLIEEKDKLKKIQKEFKEHYKSTLQKLEKRDSDITKLKTQVNDQSTENNVLFVKMETEITTLKSNLEQAPNQTLESIEQIKKLSIVSVFHN